MHKLRNKIFLYVSILLILPAIPLSYFTSQLLNRSYQIGVNENVETALDGALQIAADYYQSSKEKLKRVIILIKDSGNKSDKTISRIINNEIPEASYKVSVIGEELESQENIIPNISIKSFFKNKMTEIIWPVEDRNQFHALVKLSNKQLLQIVYPLPESFQTSAKKIQEVNQIYKTLGFVKEEIGLSFLYTFLFIYGLGLLIALFVSFWFSQKITNPIEKLKEAAREIGKGNLDYRTEISGKNELAELGTAFNQMAEELLENQRKIIELEKMTTWRQLARRLAHEIKNPLTPIQLMSQQIADNYKGDDKNYENMVKECCSIIEQEVDSLKNLVREFSDFARLPEIQPTVQNINDLINSIGKLYQASEVNLELPDTDIMVSYDYDYMKRALINLVDNALAATDLNDPVEISVKKLEKNVQIEVRDKGEGIPSENIQKIFEPYFSTKRSGVGLGLSIVKKIVEEHGGKIEVISELGKGTSFRMNFHLDPNQNTDQ